MRVWKGWHLDGVRLESRDRYLGWESTWYDGPIYCFGFWWFHLYLCWPDKWPPDKET